MNRSPTTPLNTVTANEELIEQVHPGHGIPSQDPESAAQFQLEPEEAKREAKSVLVGGGMVAGAATGATLGIAVAGPVGVVVGGTVGAVVGALGAEVAGTMMSEGDSTNADIRLADREHVHIDNSAGNGRSSASVDKVIKASTPDNK